MIFKKVYPWLILLILIIPAFYSLIRPGYFWMQDDLQAFRIQQLDKCIQDFQIPCRWVPDAGYQYGYPQFNYYPPSVYYLGEAFHLIGFQFIDAVKILFILGFILAAFTMFIFLKSWLGIFPAFIGALLYTYAPYKAVDVYVRGALSEFWSFVFFPLIFWAIFQLIKTSNSKYIGWLALSIGLLLLTHNLMSMIFLPIAAIWAILWIILEKKWQIFPKLFLGGLLGIGLASSFTLPVIFEQQYAHVESMMGGYFDYRQHYVDINQLFISNHWGYGSSYLGPNDDLSLSTGQVIWMGAMLSLILAALFFKKNIKISVAVFVLVIVELAALFLTHQKSTFIWDRVFLLQYLQFPWRILANSIFLLTTMTAVGLYLMGRRVVLIVGTAMLIITFLLYNNFFVPHKWFDISDKDKFSGELWQKELTISIFDYLPIYAKLPPIQKAPELPEIMDGKARFLSYEKGSNFQTGEIIVEERTGIRLPLFDFPGMKVFVDDQEVPHYHNDCRKQEFCLGLISFNINPGQHIIKAQLTNTVIRTIGDILTAGSFLITSFLLFKKKE